MSNFPARLVDEYVELITNEHRGKPNYEAMIRGVLQPLVNDFNFNLALNEAFDVDTAIGVQLDQIGIWVGFPRIIKAPIYVYFSFDIPELGFDLGLWKGRFDPESGLIELDDETYRFFIKVKIGANHWDGSLPEFDRVMNKILQTDNTGVFVVDNQDMSMDVYFYGMPVSALVRGVLLNGYLAMKSEAVRWEYNEPSVLKTPYFGFDVESEKVNGFDVGSFAISLRN